MTTPYGTAVLNDPPPAHDASNDKDPWSCEECGAPVPGTKDGRKPRLMLCEAHRKNRPRGATGEKSTSPRGGQHARIATGMTALHGMAGFALTMLTIPTGDDVWGRDGQIIAENSVAIGEAWAKYADNNPQLQKALVKFLDTAGTLSIAGAYAPVVMGMVMNHRTTPPKNVAPARPAQSPMQPPVMPMPSPTTPPGGGGMPVFTPSPNGNGLPFPTDIIE